MKPSEELQAAMALVDTPEKWTRGAYARDWKGNIVPSDSFSACKFCSSGALSRTNASSYATFVLEEEMEGNIPMFNDSHNHQEVILMWKRTIDKLQALGL